MQVPGSKRIFIAITLSEEARLEAQRLAVEVSALSDGIRSVRKNAFHVTIKFLGNIDNVQVRDVTSRIEKLSAGINEFDMELEGTGVFPAWRSPRVLWIGIGSGREALLTIAGSVLKALENIGRPASRDGFIPHVTVARVKRIGAREKRQLKETLDSFNVQPERTSVKEISVFSSELTSKGPRYTLIKSVPFLPGV